MVEIRQGRPMQGAMFLEQRVSDAIERVRMFEPPEGYVLCFSGGKDSVCLRAICELAGVKFEAHYNVTTIDPPPVIRFMRRHYPDTKFIKPPGGKGFVQLVREKGLPGRRRRWCCEELKEHSPQHRLLLTGMRDAEKRQSGNVRLTRVCRRGARMIQPLCDWQDCDVWAFIWSRHLPYCELYDEGWKRIGCVCCPFSSRADLGRNRLRWPAMFEAVRRACHVRWENHWRYEKEARRFDGPDAIFEWWLARDLPYPPIREVARD